MAAPEGNEFWKQRSKHGRELIFESPTILWEAACEYFQWCDENPFIEVDYRGTNGKVELPKMRPYTLEGLTLYLHVSTQYFKEFKKTVANKENGEDFLLVVTRIQEIIYNQKYSGAAAGFFNHNIIARDLGLKDHTDSSNKTDVSGKIEISITRTSTPIRKTEDEQ